MEDIRDPLGKMPRGILEGQVEETSLLRWMSWQDWAFLLCVSRTRLTVIQLRKVILVTFLLVIPTTELLGGCKEW